MKTIKNDMDAYSDDYDYQEQPEKSECERCMDGEDVPCDFIPQSDECDCRRNE